MATVSVFGLGYVGCVLAACLAERGHDVIGVDVNAMKVEMLNRGESPLIEPGLGELIHKNVSGNRLKATSDSEWAILNSDLSFICVGTPSNANGSLDTDYVTRVCEDIGSALAKKDGLRRSVGDRSELVRRSLGRISLLPSQNPIEPFYSGYVGSICRSRELLVGGQ